MGRKPIPEDEATYVFRYTRRIDERSIGTGPIDIYKLDRKNDRVVLFDVPSYQRSRNKTWCSSWRTVSELDGLVLLGEAEYRTRESAIRDLVALRNVEILDDF